MKINLQAPVCQTGYGYVSMYLLEALLKEGADISLFPIGGINPDLRFHNDVRQSIQNSSSYDYTAPCLKVWHQHSLHENIGRGNFCAYTFFELNKFTEREKLCLCSVDKLFVASNWAKNVVLDEIGKTSDWYDKSNTYLAKENVVVVPLGVSRDVFYDVKPQPTANPTIFCSIGKWTLNKSHDILIQAFNEAFGVNDNVELWVMAHNPFLTKEQTQEWHDLYLNSKLGNKIKLLPPVKTHTEVAEVLRNIDVFVALSRGEAANMELIEALSCGKHAIATNYSGHTEYVNEANAHLVEIDSLEDAFDPPWFMGQGQWAYIGDDQIQQTIQHMQKLHNLKQKEGYLYNEEGVISMSQYTWKNTAKLILAAL